MGKRGFSNRWTWTLAVGVVSLAASSEGVAFGPSNWQTPPFALQVREHVTKLSSEDPRVRAEGLEKLGYLRAYDAETAVIAMLGDPHARVRREAAMALGWCGGREAIRPLLSAMEDGDWTVRQAARVALTNLTGMEFPLDALADEAVRREQTAKWRSWCETALRQSPPKDVLALLSVLPRSGTAERATASTTYKGPPEVVLDGALEGAYWQTKLVDPPQSITLDIGRAKRIDRVIVYQYSDAFVMNEYALETSLDGEEFETVKRKKGRTPVKLVIAIPPRDARYVRITSYGSVNPVYPTTFFEVQVLGVGEQSPTTAGSSSEITWRCERGVRALGVFGGPGAVKAILATLGERPPGGTEHGPTVRAALRSLGRLGGERAFQRLVSLLDDPAWARYAADALGDLGDPRAVPHLLAAYARYAKTVEGADPPDVPRDDRMSFPSIDRMLETPYWIAYALGRLDVASEADRRTLRALAPRIMANLPGDHDTFFLYEPEVAHLLTWHLMAEAGRLAEAREHAFSVLGLPHRISWKQLAKIECGEVPHPLRELDENALRAGIVSHEETAVWSRFPPERIGSWLPLACVDPDDVPRLALLLDHPEGWVRLNAAKALAWIDDARAIDPLLRRLESAPSEAAFGYNATFKNEEYDDPAPRWREGLIRALGLLSAHQATPTIVSVLEDEGSVAEVRLAAAQALGDLGNEQAIAALKKAAVSHDFFVVRHAARDAIRRLGHDLVPGAIKERSLVANPPQTPDAERDAPETFDAVIFLRGSNNIPNTIGTVEQADRWRSEYAVTDSGPAYRPGRNLMVLSPPRPDGEVRPLTQFEGGYVADPEISWDGQTVLFSRRGEDDPWWHVWRIGVDGRGLKQLTFGPYHAVGPVYLPDGRIAFCSSRSGIRDEYHGYPCTALCVMNADGSNIRPLATNIGRDNEPSILDDGRIVFSRLEVFYSRNKTELTLHAVQPDGAMDVVLYGPERRQFWRSLDHGPKTPADGQEAPLTHRVLRVTQPQQLADGRHIILSTQAGLTKIGARRDTEENIMTDFRERSYTTPFPLPDGRILCASTWKAAEREDVDLGLYVFDPATKELTLLFNDPETADFEPRPVMARRPPPLRPSRVAPGQYGGRFLCTSVFATQEPEVQRRGRYVRLIEGVPVPARHSTHTNQHEVWKNHGGTFARILGTAPLAPDGSFYVDAPADRLLHFQVLDSDRRVVGNQKTWIYPRPGEQKSCIGCHENPHSTTRGNNPLASHEPPIDLLPDGREFTYRAKAWFKGSLPDAIEERTRTVRAVNLLGR